jgi:tetratricopeptide (TPR) repeat protein
MSRRRLWLFRIAAVVLSLFPFVVLELGLRWLGYGHDPQLIVPVKDAAAPGTHQLNPSADRAYYGPMDLSGPEPRPFVLPKPKGLYRILVIGGSTVAGFPYPFELALPRQLQVVLEQQSPDRRFEVLNAGITAINSRSEVDIVRQGVGCDPDLIIVHSGHNEFYGPGGAASTASVFAPGLHPLLDIVRRQRLFQLAGAVVYRPLRGHPQETLPADIAIALDSPVFAKALESYEAHLRQMAALAAKAGIPLLLTSVPSNLRDQSPMHALSRSDLTDAQRQEQADRQKAAAQHLSYREYDKALAALATARQVDPQNALLAYREAQCLEMLGRRAAAAEAYAWAADLDGCRFRAPSAFNAAVRRVVSSCSGAVRFCDVAALLRDQSKLPAPGEDFFLEHVHYNLEGAWRVALILGKFIQEQFLGAEWREERIPRDERRDELLGVTPLDRLAADTFALMVVQAWPLNLAPDSPLQAERVKTRLGQEYALLSPLDRRIFADLTLDAMQQDLLGGMAAGYRAAGREDLAKEMLRRRRLRRPWDTPD